MNYDNLTPEEIKTMQKVEHLNRMELDEYLGERNEI